MDTPGGIAKKEVAPSQDARSKAGRRVASLLLMQDKVAEYVLLAEPFDASHSHTQDKASSSACDSGSNGLSGPPQETATREPIQRADTNAGSRSLRLRGPDHDSDSPSMTGSDGTSMQIDDPCLDQQELHSTELLGADKGRPTGQRQPDAHANEALLQARRRMMDEKAWVAQQEQINKYLQEQEQRRLGINAKDQTRTREIALSSFDDTQRHIAPPNNLPEGVTDDAPYTPQRHQLPRQSLTRSQVSADAMSSRSKSISGAMSSSSSSSSSSRVADRECSSRSIDSSQRISRSANGSSRRSSEMPPSRPPPSPPRSVGRA
jgi:hypothetical protein